MSSLSCRPRQPADWWQPEGSNVRPRGDSGKQLRGSRDLTQPICAVVVSLQARSLDAAIIAERSYDVSDATGMQMPVATRVVRGTFGVGRRRQPNLPRRSKFSLVTNNCFNNKTTRIPFGERRRTRAGWSDPALILLQSFSQATHRKRMPTDQDRL